MMQMTTWRAWIVVACLACCQIGAAESSIPLLGGFDRERIERAYPPSDKEALGELAKLVYRVRAIDPNTLRRLVDAQREPEIGDVIRVDGRVEGLDRLNVPESLVEFLEFSEFFVIDIEETSRRTRLISARQPAGIQIGDRVAAIGVVAHQANGDSGDKGQSLAGQSLAVVTGNVQWYPQTPASIGQQLLRDNGFDLGLLPDVAARNRRPLLAEDGDAFYTMLSTATALHRSAQLPSPIEADPVALLKSPQELGGQWVHMNLESVQMTRIAVPEPHRQEQLGSDHYFQIDAVGDLGNVVIKIEHPDKSRPPATIQGRYPVSIVTTTLPDFFRDELQVPSGSEAVVAPVRLKFGVDGFFYRLWGYESDFMAQHGGGQQFGPLVIASRFDSQEPASEDPVGVGAIGTVAAAVVLIAMGLIWWWQRRVWAGDDEARRRRQEYQQDRVQLPQ